MFVYSSFFEWVLHRYIMHDDRFMKYAHEAHQLLHHDIFRADATYFLNKEIHTKEAESHLTFAWWNAPLLIGMHLPFFVGFWFLGAMTAGWVGGIVATVFSFSAIVSYYALYEYLHYCMHVPGNRWFERTKFFNYVQNHHRLHHVYYKKNLNVVIPIADFILGSMVRLEDPAIFDKLEAVRQRRTERSTQGAAA